MYVCMYVCLKNASVIQLKVNHEKSNE